MAGKTAQSGNTAEVLKLQRQSKSMRPTENEAGMCAGVSTRSTRLPDRLEFVDL